MTKRPKTPRRRFKAVSPLLAPNQSQSIGGSSFEATFRESQDENAIYVKCSLQAANGPKWQLGPVGK